ncbi:MAG: hypothetical protein RI973_828 [Bacteroidota bacterium]|jgi:prefoldin subunit 5
MRREKFFNKASAVAALSSAFGWLASFFRAAFTALGGFFSGLSSLFFHSVKDRFVYNVHTLQYERRRVTMRERLIRFLGFQSAIIVTSAIIVAAGWRFLPSVKEKLYMEEIQQLKGQLSMFESDYGRLTKELNHLQERDRTIHRVVLNMEPMDEDIWEGGIGGSERYTELQNYPSSGNAMAQLRQKVDKLKRQLAAQAKSYDEIEKVAKSKEARLSSIPSIKPVNSDKLDRGVELLSGFGYRMHPVHKIVRMHTGIDFTAPKGTPIQATGDGVVIEVGNKKNGYGQHVVINHGYGYKTLYGHMYTITVKRGQKVKKGQQIGTVGSTGISTAPHCHYEVHHKGKPVNPLDYVMDGLTPQEYQELVRLSELTNQSFD